MKLSKTQAEVVDLMRNGWELHRSHIGRRPCWLQKGEWGRGAEWKTVFRSTLTALVRAGVVEVAKRKFPVTTYKLTNAIKDDRAMDGEQRMEGDGGEMDTL